MQLGKFIVIEGADAVGKSTQVKRITAALTKNFIKTIQTREPGGSVAAEAIRDLVVNAKGDVSFTDMTEMLLFTAARQQHLKDTIIPVMEQGKWVVCDRYLLSTMAYQATDNVSEELIAKTHKLYNKLVPDITYILTLPHDVREHRLSARGVVNEFDKRSLEYQRLVASRYARSSLILEHVLPEMVTVTIDADTSETAISEVILKDISERFDVDIQM